VESKKCDLNEVLGNSYYLTKNNYNIPNKMNYIICYSDYVIGIGKMKIHQKLSDYQVVIALII